MWSYGNHKCDWYLNSTQINFYKEILILWYIKRHRSFVVSNSDRFVNTWKLYHIEIPWSHQNWCNVICFITLESFTSCTSVTDLITNLSHRQPLFQIISIFNRSSLPIFWRHVYSDPIVYPSRDVNTAIRLVQASWRCDKIVFTAQE